MVKVEINGIEIEAREGSMVIEAADQAGIAIPRFCYHKKLSIAANCRMCLVEVEKAPKPLPACATPVTEGMKVITDSPKAIAAQKGVMEFLLINHPLDCPICDQGGECELQDLAMGYGSDVSRYAESKRVVKDKNIGSLISTDLTRCIHCTRCIRFGAEVAGVRELGATGRGEHMTIGTYLEESVSSEMSGNVIDLCPVGALTSKPFRFQARAWEMTQHEGIAPHDGLGTNIYLHTRRGKVMRVVPRDNESINECWISDRDRFSYLGIDSDDRLTTPLIKQDGAWRAASWEEALEAAARGIAATTADGGDALGVLASPGATLEELYLTQKLARGLGCSNIDHRLRQVDFRDDDAAPLYPALGMSLAELEEQEAILLVGSNIRKEQPLAAHRVRKAALYGAAVHAVNPIDFDFHFDIAEKCIAAPARLVGELAAVASAVAELGHAKIPQGLEQALSGVEVNEKHRAIAASLKSADRGVVLVGNLANTDPNAATMRALAAFIAQSAAVRIGYLPEAANNAGAWIAGALPRRGTAGARSDPGLDAAAMVAAPRKGYLLLGVEPDRDSADARATVAALAQAEHVVALSAYRTPALERVADVLLPIALFAETSGTYISAQGDWQSFKGAALPPGDSRPAWKVLRVLANLLKVEGFDYASSEQVLSELRGMVGSQAVSALNIDTIPAPQATINGALQRIGDVPIYAVDALVRRSQPLQATADAERAWIAVAPTLADRLGLQGAELAVAVQGEGRVTLPLSIDERVPDGVVWLAAGLAETAELGPAMGPIELVHG
ncbi:MAG: NADH-quinone oxidoreductase subunit G [Proteobacteria bacterium]|nr:MAG: NADH-quinone oxidoreductase subunit G [Pseudomonadota bacterium]QKK12206.1 MAG: NADH-quinone oxidoreductase subunit G [Pseudomonadota bacterium]